jgi:hypothetical protein
MKLKQFFEPRLLDIPNQDQGHQIHIDERMSMHFEQISLNLIGTKQPIQTDYYRRWRLQQKSGSIK